MKHENAVVEKGADGIERAHVDEESTLQMLTFVQSGEVYGIPLDTVREVIDLTDITSIPLVPDYIRGVINLRGKVIPVIDLEARFSGNAAAHKKMTSIIVNEIPYEDDIVEVGLMIDQVKEVVMFPKDDIDETPDFGTKIRTDFIAGIGRYAQHYIIILDTMRVLDIDELSRFSHPGTS